MNSFIELFLTVLNAVSSTTFDIQRFNDKLINYSYEYYTIWKNMTIRFFSINLNYGSIFIPVGEIFLCLSVYVCEEGEMLVECEGREAAVLVCICYCIICKQDTWWSEGCVIEGVRSVSFGISEGKRYQRHETRSREKKKKKDPRVMGKLERKGEKREGEYDQYNLFHC